MGMSNMGKSFTLIVILIMVTASVIAVGTTYAQLIPKPSVPEFTLKYVRASYSVTTIDPYTGASTIQQKDNSTIEITIKNQLFTYFFNNTNYYLYYNIAYQGHFEKGNWTDLYYYHNYIPSSSDFIPNMLPQTKNSEYTVTSIPANFPANAQVDFEVQAIEMHDGQVYYIPHLGMQEVSDPGIVLGQTSNWSNIKTINLTDNSVSVSTSPSPTPTVPEFSWLMILPLFIFTLPIAVIFKLRNLGK
jgi:hypothetical protein